MLFIGPFFYGSIKCVPLIHKLLVYGLGSPLIFSFSNFFSLVIEWMRRLPFCVVGNWVDGWARCIRVVLVLVLGVVSIICCVGKQCWLVEGFLFIF